MNRLDNALDSEGQWWDFRDEHVGEDDEQSGRRFIRLNPDLHRDPPSLDAKDEVKELQEYVQKQLKLRDLYAQIQDVAHRLIASSFFFHKTSVSAPKESEDYICEGRSFLQDGYIAELFKVH